MPSNHGQAVPELMTLPLFCMPNALARMAYMSLMRFMALRWCGVLLARCIQAARVRPTWYFSSSFTKAPNNLRQIAASSPPRAWLLQRSKMLYKY